MSIEKQAQLVLRLYKKSLDQKLEWKPAVQDGVFQVSFADYSVQISEIERAGSTDFRIDILNSEGEIADRFTDNDIAPVPGAPLKASTAEGLSPSWYKTMGALYELARRSALGADKALDNLLTELDDDLPF